MEKMLFAIAYSYNNWPDEVAPTPGIVVIKEINLVSTSSNFSIPRPDGSEIPARSWGSENAREIVLLVHGLGAHSGWFEAFARQLKIRGAFAVSYDHIGFGKQRGRSFSSYTDWLEDLVCVFEYLKDHYQGVPVYLAGNSMGALLSLVSVQRISPDGLILLSPGFDGFPQTFTTAYRVSTVIKALLRPESEVKLPYTAAFCTRDEATQKWIEQDPEGRFMVPGKMLLALLKLSNAVKHSTGSITMPALMITAGLDRIVNNEINNRFFQKLIAPAKQAKRYDQSFHDLMFDPVVDEVADTVIAWIAEHANEKLASGQ